METPTPLEEIKDEATPSRLINCVLLFTRVAMISNEIDKRFSIGRSTIKGAGNGLFAKTLIPKGDKLEVVGVLVLAKSLADKCTAYADAYKFRVGKHLLIPTGLGGIANHSTNPNAKKTIEGSRVFLTALRDINKGEEVLYVYSGYAQKKFISPT